jgi:transposase-like protein
MPKEQRTFTKEFKLEAVRLVQSSGKSITGVNSWRSRASRRFLGVGIRPLKKRSFAASNTSWKSCDRNATF